MCAVGELFMRGCTQDPAGVQYIPPRLSQSVSCPRTTFQQLRPPLQFHGKASMSNTFPYTTMPLLREPASSHPLSSAVRIERKADCTLETKKSTPMLRGENPRSDLDQRVRKRERERLFPRASDIERVECKAVSRTRDNIVLRKLEYLVEHANEAVTACRQERGVVW